MEHIERIETDEFDPKFYMPYAGAIKVHSGKMLFLAGVTAAPVYHSHPHVSSEFDDIPSDPGQQARATMENVKKVLEAAGGSFSDIVQIMYFMVDQAKNQGFVYPVVHEYFGDHKPASTSVEIPRVATDPRLILEVQCIAVVPE
jgi:enamine deaminase RidA (YjgF/YER057c/UK114 family)